MLCFAVGKTPKHTPGGIWLLHACGMHDCCTFARLCLCSALLCVWVLLHVNAHRRTQLALETWETLSRTAHTPSTILLGDAAVNSLQGVVPSVPPAPHTLPHALPPGSPSAPPAHLAGTPLLNLTQPTAGGAPQPVLLLPAASLAQPQPQTQHVHNHPDTACGAEAEGSVLHAEAVSSPALCIPGSAGGGYRDGVDALAGASGLPAGLSGQQRDTKRSHVSMSGPEEGGLGACGAEEGGEEAVAVAGRAARRMRND
jgi:hypothetical protein